MQFGEGMDCSFIRSVQLTLGTMGKYFSYHRLMGISGAAFRVHFHPDWSPSAGDVTAGFDVSTPLFRALDYDTEMVAIDDNKFTDIRTFYGRIISQINRGVPVIAINLKVCPEWGIITGYLKDKRGLLCRTFFDGSEAYSRADRAPWLSLFISGKAKTSVSGMAEDPTSRIAEDPTSRNVKFSLHGEELLKNSLRLAVRLWETDQFGEYASGIAAYLYWIGELQDFDPDPGASRFVQTMEVNRILLDLLLDARRSAFHFLQESGAASKITRGDEITGQYGMLYQLLEKALKKEIPSPGKGPRLWTTEVIHRQIELLTEAMELEGEAIACIRETLCDEDQE